MGPPIVYDWLRLFLGAFSHSPRGVDRVDVSYARFLLENWPNECLGLLPTPWGIRLYGRDCALRMLETVQTSWQERQRAEVDPTIAHLRGWLGGTPFPERAVAQSRRSGTLDRGVRFLRENGVHWGQPVTHSAPRNAIYLNIGQVGWAAPVMTRWLRYRPDIKPVFMLHDMIPLQYPELVSHGGRLAHIWMVRTVLRKAAGLITTTRSASDTVVATLRRHGFPVVPLRSLHLPIADVFLEHDSPDEDLRRHPYFVVCGAIEPRKNHLLLLKVWRRLVGELGRSAPHLVVVGSPAHQGEQILREFREASDLRSHVTTVCGMPSSSLRVVMANARAVLMPSLAEGFGLPVIESLAVGTPVLASDLLAHREVGEGLAVYLNPKDDAAWFDAIMSLVENTSEASTLRQSISRYRPVSESDYFGSIGEFLASFA